MSTTLIANDNIVSWIIAAVATANVTITILQYQFRITPRSPKRLTAIVYALLNAARRGVKINILLNDSTRSRPGGRQHGTLAELLDHPNITISHHTGKSILHTKLLLVDKHMAILGSHNYSASSFSRSLNLSVATDEQALIDQATTIANNLISRSINGKR